MRPSSCGRVMVKPSIRKRKGFIISRFMVDRELNKVVVLSMWMRKEDVYESAEWTRQQIDQFTQMLVAPPVVEILEVAGEVERII
jgi:hypothetical protein